MGEESKSVTIANIRRPFWSMVFVTVKWAIASISAFVILSVVFGDERGKPPQWTS